ncbi:hypothetical protein [Actinomycetospora sp.]|jgi:hypothetical protein|uniref:hypothetical protein n=1 Tax=Actinomycetospora sp. TaxID=1872135 RepID=UPI002F3F8191
MGDRGAVIGGGLLGILAVAGAATVLVSSPPPAVFAIVLLCSVVTLGAVGMWAAGRSRRPAMWVAVVGAAVTALLCVPPMAFPDEPIGAGGRLYFALVIVLTIVAIVLVRGELSRGTPQARSTRVA